MDPQTMAARRQSLPLRSGYESSIDELDSNRPKQTLTVDTRPFSSASVTPSTSPTRSLITSPDFSGGDSLSDRESEEDSRSTLRLLERAQQHNLCLKETIQLKDQKIRLLQQELARRSGASFGDETAKNISTLVSRLSLSDEVIAKQKNDINDLHEKLRDKDLQIEGYVSDIQSLHQRLEQSSELMRMLKKAQTDLRQAQTMNERKELEVKDLLNKVSHLTGMVSSKKTAAKPKTQDLLNQIRGLEQDNQELEQRFSMKNFEVKELKAVKEGFEEELSRMMAKANDLEEEVAQLKQINKTESLRAQEKIQEAHAQAEASASQLREANFKIQGLQQELTLKEETIQQLKSSNSFLQSELQHAQAELELCTNQLRVSQRNVDADYEEIRTYKQRIQDSESRLKESQKQIAFHEAHIRSLRDKLIQNQRQQPSQIQLAQELEQFARASKNEKISFMVDKINTLRTDYLREKEASEAFREQTSFLGSEMSKIQRDHSMQMKLKTETINRLSQELEELTKSISTSYPTTSSSSSSSSSSSISRRPNLAVEDLKSEVSLLKRELFYATAAVIKLQYTQKSNGKSPNVNLDDLYFSLPKDLPFQDWPNWLESSISKTVDDENDPSKNPTISPTADIFVAPSTTSQRYMGSPTRPNTTSRRQY